MINNVTLVGRITKDIEVRYTTSGSAVADFNLAVNRQFTNQNGEREADFIRCQIWRNSAENLAKYTSKGSLIGIEGRIQTRSYENQQGDKVYVTEVIVDSFSLLDSRKDKDSSQNQQSSSFEPQESNNSNSNSSKGLSDPFADNGQPIEIPDDDLPF